MLFTHYSNRFENLAAIAAEIIRQPLQQPLAPEVVLIQSYGISRWLAMVFADCFGICANIRFEFPARYSWELMQLERGDLEPLSRFEPPVLSWQIFERLQNLGTDKGFEPLRTYIGDPGSEQGKVRAFQLALRIAEVYEQYLIYRPDWIERWQRGEYREHQPEVWQALLWRQLLGQDQNHRVTAQQRFIHTLAAADRPPENFPERLTVVGISALAPTHLALLAAVAEVIDVHLLLLNPCQEYWGDIVADRDIARRGTDPQADTEYLEVGHPLLASLGKQGRDFIDMVQNFPAEITETYQETTESSLLQRMQNDILYLRSPDAAGPRPFVLAPDDRSVQIHVCHSAMREVEVLYDQLLCIFDESPEIKPADIVVMTPDINTYSPLITAVFEAHAQTAAPIPFSIADRGLRQRNQLIDTFFSILQLPRGRFDVNSLLSLLRCRAIRQRFGLAEDDLALIQHWLRQTGIRWGIDETNRAELELPGFREHSWQAGLERLLLGLVLPDEDLYENILAYPDVEGSTAQIMGHLQQFAATVFSVNQLPEQSVSEWGVTLNDLLARFFCIQDTEDENQLQLIRTAIAELAANTALAGYRQAVGIDIICTALKHALTIDRSGSGFFSGGVTFCTMVPMRSIPFSVVCLIGMNSDRYPRAQPVVDFNLLLQRFRKGDRSRRQDDRYLFLEAIVAARQGLYISYVGQDIHDNSELPPSVLVAELVDTVAQTVGCTNGEIRDRLLVKHPLQAFSRRYFDGSEPGLFSYSKTMALLSRQTGQKRDETTRFFTKALPPPDLTTLELAALKEFWQHPVRYLTRRRLGILLPETPIVLEDSEPFSVEGLAAYGLREQMAAMQLQAIAPEQARTRLQAGGKLPHGQVGDRVFAEQWQQVRRFVGRLRRFRRNREYGVIEAPLDCCGLTLSVRLDEISTEGYFGYRQAVVSARDIVRLWLTHIVLNCLAPRGVQLYSHWLGRDAQIRLPPLSQPERYLETLLGLYREGMCRPLPFFPNTSRTYVATLMAASRRSDPVLKARQTWLGNDYQPGEADDPYYQLVYPHRDVADDPEFQNLAQQVLAPVLMLIDSTDEK